jgi:hypothetical protein
VSRRAFIAAMGMASLSPLLAGAQQTEPIKHVGALMSTGEGDAKEQANLAAFAARLKELGWIEGRNLHLDIRWGAADDERNRRYAAELVALAPDVILADTSQTVAALQRRRVQSLSCSPARPTLWVPALSKASRGLVAIPPALPCSNTRSPESGSNSCDRSHRT